MIREIRGQLLTWFGIVGSALTIIDQWGNFIQLADWMRLVVENFSYATHAFWSFVGGLINISISRELAQFLTFIAAQISLILGTVLISGRINTLKSANEMYLDVKKRYLTYIVAIAFVIIVFYVDRTSAPTLLIAIVGSEIFYERNNEDIRYKEITIILLFTFALLNSPGFPQSDVARFFWSFFWLLPLFMCPAKPLLKRLIFIFIGVALIIGLSEISKLAERLQTQIESSQAAISISATRPI